MSADDPFFHRDLTLRVRDRRLRLAVSQELFSSHTIDSGTLRLIKSLERLDLSPSSAVLDLGCGYGPLGLAAAVLAPEGRVTMVDRDALAVEYAARNAAAASLAATAYGSLGYDDVGDGPFDLVVSNVPGKAPPAVHEELVAGAARHLAPGGLAAIVVVEPLTALVDEMLEAAGAEVLLRDPSKAYSVFHYRFADAPRTVEPPGFAGGLYYRGELGAVRTSWGLPEFDQLGFATELALGLLGDEPGGDVGAVNPGQGHLAAACSPATVTLADRDLLALRTTAANLVTRSAAEQAIKLVHSSVPPGFPELDLGILSLRPKEPREVHVRQASSLAAALRPGGRIIVSGPATHVGRLVHAVAGDLRAGRTDQARGHSAVELRTVRGRASDAVQ